MKCHSIKLALPTLLAAACIATPTMADNGNEPNDNTVTEVTVTGTRENTPKAETPASITILNSTDITDVGPAHPGDVMNRVPGVHVNVTNGEGHMTSIRQPMTTGPVYLYLEDGVPTRSTGFFNHNALYEVNVPQSGGVEVNRGPGSALYGSDAIGGVINVLTEEPPLESEASLTLEGGAYGFGRALLSAGGSWDDDGVIGNLNVTHTDGWRDATQYDRQSAGLRWDRAIGEAAMLKTVFSASNINQATAGSSALSRTDYETSPTTNYTPISYRDVQAARLSVAYEREGDSSLLSLTPYARWNNMDMLPNWSLSYDPSINSSGHSSVGMLAKYRYDFAPGRTRLVAGADLDYSPGSYQEYAITPTKVGSIYTDYTLGAKQYDYDAAFMMASPYLHLETSPAKRLRLTGGVRVDAMRYDYTNNMTVETAGAHRRPGDTTVDYLHVSPKLGATAEIGGGVNAFANYAHAFRAPSAGQLFRQGGNVDSINLEPVKVDSFEVGLRRSEGPATVELAAYYMTKKDDILSYQDALGDRYTLNAGETLHRGVELAAGYRFSPQLELDLAASYAIHEFEDWQPKPTVDYSGNEMSAAPRLVGNATIAWKPGFLPGARLEAEWVKMGKYWEDDANSSEYEGHDLFNLRASWEMNERFRLFGRVMNVTDERYATRASYNAFRGEELAPGMPLTAYGGIEMKF